MGEDSGYPHDGRADKNPYPHDRVPIRILIGTTVVHIASAVGESK